MGEDKSADTKDWFLFGVICFLARRCLRISMARCLALLIASVLADLFRSTKFFGVFLVFAVTFS